MIQEIANTEIMGFSLTAIIGMVTFTSFAFTAFIGYTNHKGKKVIPFRWHPRMVVVSFFIASIHAFLAFSRVVGF